MKIAYVRRIVAGVICIAVALAICLHTGIGTLSGFDIGGIALLCPLGALETMLAAKIAVPTALVSLAVAVVVIVLVGKAFCSWVCPVSLVREFRENRRKKRQKQADALPTEASSTTDGILEQASLEGSEDLVSVDASACASCADCSTDVQTSGKHPLFDSRHAILLGTLASAAVFGFPVFCLVCPIGLLFGTVILLYQFFGDVGDVSWALVIFPVVLVLELTVLRSWCSKFCPLGALISLVSRANRLLRPRVDESRCLRMNGGSCDSCSESCLEGLDPHVAKGMQDCSKCARCKDVCPVSAISFIGRKGASVRIKNE